MELTRVPTQEELASMEDGSAPSTTGGGKRGMTLSWSNIQFAPIVGENKEAKQLLSPQSGTANPGKVLGIMGSSGAGKSTLLDVLAGRLESPYLTGDMMINGDKMDKDSFRKISGYVMQSDALFPLLTVRETIMYACHLRVHGKTYAEKEEIVNQTIALLKLEKCENTIIGDEMNRGLSGGEKRRVSVAVDIVHSPAVLFLDEPTSGLDSSTAMSVIDSLRSLAQQKGCTIVLTIHQPSARLFNLLDDVIFLASGKVTYNGPISKLGNKIIDTYKIANLGAPPLGNLPELWLDMCELLAEKDNMAVVTDAYAAGGVDVAIVPSADGSTVAAGGEGYGNVYANSFFGDFYYLCSRASLNMTRTPELFVARLGSSVGFGVLIGTLFLFTPDTLLGVQHRMSYFVFCVAFFYYTSLEALPIFIGEREVFQREYSRGAYRASAYTLANTAVNILPMLTVATVFTIVTYWLIGLPHATEVFFFHILTIFTILMAGSSFATMVSTIVPNPMVGQTAGSAILSIMFLFSGFFIRTADIPDWWIWLHYLSLFKYSFDSLIVNDLSGVHFDGLSNKYILDLYSMGNVDKGRGIAVLWGFTIFFRLVFWRRLTTAFTGKRN